MTTKSAPGFFRQFLLRRGRCWLCRKLCRDEFFNRDASLEIDALTIANEKLRAEGKKR